MTFELKPVYQTTATHNGRTVLQRSFTAKDGLNALIRAEKLVALKTPAYTKWGEWTSETRLIRTRTSKEGDFMQTLQRKSERMLATHHKEQNNVMG